MTLKGSDIKATDSLAIDTDGQLNLLTATDEHFYRKDEQKKGFTVTAQGNGSSSITERQNQLEGGDITINAGQGVLLQVGQREGESLQANLTALANEPGMAWVNQVSQMPGVKLEAVQEAYEQWNYSQQSLSPIASSIIAIALAVATGGAGALAMGAAEGTATAAMANAAFSTLVSQATISTINNGGNLGAVLKDLGSSANIKQLATAVATAGALSGFDQWAGLDSAAKQANNPFAQPGAADLMSWDTFNRVTGHATISAGINSTINGGSFGDAFKDSLLANIQGQVGKSVAGVIGDNGNALGEAGKVVAHGVTSGAIAEITGGKFAAGAAGGAMSELASNWSLGAFGGNEEYQVALNKVLGGLAAAAVTGDEHDFDTGADRAETVHRYNYLEHKERSERDSLLREAQKGNLTEAQQERLAALNFKDALSDETLLKACISGSASECQTARQDALAKADTYPNLGYQYPKESLAGYQQIDRLLAGTTEEAIQTQRMYDGLVASYERIGMSAENAKTLVGYQLGAIYVFGGVAGAKSMSAVEKGLANSAGQRYQETAKTSMAEQIKANIAESQQARESSNFGIHIAKSDQIRWGYAADEWGFVTLPVGSKVYGGIPGQSSYYTSWDTLSSAGFSRELILKSLQVLPHPEFGYRPKMGVYEVMNELSVPSGQVIANPLLGPGGGDQYFIKDFGNQLKLIDTINLDK